MSRISEITSALNKLPKGYLTFKTVKIKDLTCYLMMEDKIVKLFDKGALIDLGDKLAPFHQ